MTDKRNGKYRTAFILAGNRPQSVPVHALQRVEIAHGSGNAKTLTKLIVVTIGMFGFGFAWCRFITRFAR